MIKLRSYDILQEVSRRQGAIIFKARHKPSGEVPAFMDDEEPVVCAKCIDMESYALSKAQRGSVCTEARELLRLSHANVAQYHKLYVSDTHLVYLTDYAESGTLNHLMHTLRNSGEKMDEDLVWHIFLQLCMGLRKLHDAAVVHRNLTARNVLLLRETMFDHTVFKYRCKITDIRLPTIQRHCGHIALPSSSFRYLAPELVKNQKHDHKVDSWALGCVLYELLTLSHAFHSSAAIAAAEYAPIPEGRAPELAGLVAQLLVADPTKRISVSEILQMPLLHERCAGMPNAAFLESESRLAAETSRACAADASSLLREGTRVWFKSASDGRWRQGEISEQIGDDAYSVQADEAPPSSGELALHDAVVEASSIARHLGASGASFQSVTQDVVSGFGAYDGGGGEVAPGCSLLASMPSNQNFELEENSFAAASLADDATAAVVDANDVSQHDRTSVSSIHSIREAAEPSFSFKNGGHSQHIAHTPLAEISVPLSTALAQINGGGIGVPGGGGGGDGDGAVNDAVAGSGNGGVNGGVGRAVNRSSNGGNYDSASLAVKGPSARKSITAQMFTPRRSKGSSKACVIQ